MEELNKLDSLDWKLYVGITIMSLIFVSGSVILLGFWIVLKTDIFIIFSLACQFSVILFLLANVMFAIVYKKAIRGGK